jgi:RNA polymerase sigma factor (sigma-70 family)
MSPEQIIDRALERYERPLISYAKEITGDLEAARDAVQETFLRLSRQDIVSLEPRLAPWLFFVCRNCARDHNRKIVRFSQNPVDEDSPSDEPSPAAEALASEDRALLQNLVARLPQKQRELVKLKFEAGLSYKEMAETMRMSVSHVGVLLHEAIQTLRSQWNRENTGAPTP